MFSESIMMSPPFANTEEASDLLASLLLEIASAQCVSQ